MVDPSQQCQLFGGDGDEARRPLMSLSTIDVPFLSTKDDEPRTARSTP